MAATDISHLHMAQVELLGSSAVDMLEFPYSPLWNWVLSLLLICCSSGFLLGSEVTEARSSLWAVLVRRSWLSGCHLHSSEQTNLGKTGEGGGKQDQRREMCSHQSLRVHVHHRCCSSCLVTGCISRSAGGIFKSR